LKKRVGIPCGLFYYKYFPLWKSFFENLGAEVIVSGSTNRRILDLGISNSVDEACLPVKVFLGHAVSLINKVDYLFVPRFTSISKNEYICPEFGGIPDIVRRLLKKTDTTVLIDTEVNLLKSPGASWKAAVETGRYLTGDLKLIKEAYQRAVKDYRAFREKIRNGALPPDYILRFCSPARKSTDTIGQMKTFEQMKPFEQTRTFEQIKKPHLKIAVIGHPYVVYDKYLSMDLLGKLNSSGVKIFTVEMAEESAINIEAGNLRKPMFWNFGRKALGSSMHFARNSRPDGFIYVTSFGCGIDSFVCNMIERRIRTMGDMPFITITLDEHSGEAGLNTRLEAFIDMIRWKKQNESNVSASG